MDERERERGEGVKCGKGENKRGRKLERDGYTCCQGEVGLVLLLRETLKGMIYSLFLHFGDFYLLIETFSLSELFFSFSE